MDPATKQDRECCRINSFVKQK